VYSEQLSQELSIQGIIAPASKTAATYTLSAGVDMSRFVRALFILQCGAMTANSTVDMKLVESANADLSSNTDVSGSNVSITQLLAAGGDNRLATLEIRADQVTKRYVGVKVTVATAATILGVIALGGQADQKPGAALDIAGVAQRAVAA
jgi:hypothetical protein